MAVLNIHTRRLPVSESEVGALIDGIASDGDRLWPRDKWPAVRFDRPLAFGAVGGHGPVHYIVEAYEPGRWIRFRFTAPRGFHGFHEYSVRRAGDGAILLSHVLAIKLRGRARLSWPLFYRWMHDALLEDSLDCAERALTGAIRTPAEWSRYVVLLRDVGERARKRKASRQAVAAVTGGALRNVEPARDRLAQ
ncbi:SRPBCC family protein [Nocardia sp. NBC_00403]|uniref:SRPBCC family protein n=1 Tax=Nocardia sp. NBC_00403 TaxID=2975990 RepID=UPI002E1B1724